MKKSSTASENCSRLITLSTQNCFQTIYFIQITLLLLNAFLHFLLTFVIYSYCKFQCLSKFQTIFVFEKERQLWDFALPAVNLVRLSFIAPFAFNCPTPFKVSVTLEFILLQIPLPLSDWSILPHARSLSILYSYRFLTTYFNLQNTVTIPAGFFWDPLLYRSLS